MYLPCPGDGKETLTPLVPAGGIRTAEETPGLPLGEHWVSVSVTRALIGEFPVVCCCCGADGGLVGVLPPSGDVGLRGCGGEAVLLLLLLLLLLVLLLPDTAAEGCCMGNARKPSKTLTTFNFPIVGMSIMKSVWMYHLHIFAL